MKSEDPKKNNLKFEKTIYGFMNFDRLETELLMPVLHALRTSTYTFIDLLDSSIYWKDVDGKILGCNQYMLTLFGLKTRDQIVGHTDDVILKGDQLKRIKEMDQHVIHRREIYTVEEEAILPSGEKRIFITVKQPLFDERRNVIGLFGNSIDITDLKKSQAKAALEEKKKKEAEENFKDEKVFRQAVVQHAGALSHDLKNPLHGAGLHLEMMEQKIKNLQEKYNIQDEDLKQIQKHTECIRENHQRIDLSIDQSTQLIKEIASDRPKLVFQEKKLDSLLKGSLSNYEQYCGKLIQVAALPDLKLKTDPIAFYRIITNLIDNALRQILQKGQGQIFISAQKHQNFCKIQIKDTAGGLTAEQVFNFFGYFKEKKTQNTGIGLQSCRRLCGALDGMIHASLVDGDCVSFEVYLPLSE